MFRFRTHDQLQTSANVCDCGVYDKRFWSNLYESGAIWQIFKCFFILKWLFGQVGQGLYGLYVYRITGPTDDQRGRSDLIPCVHYVYRITGPTDDQRGRSDLIPCVHYVYRITGPTDDQRGLTDPILGLNIVYFQQKWIRQG